MRIGDAVIKVFKPPGRPLRPTDGAGLRIAISAVTAFAQLSSADIHAATISSPNTSAELATATSTATSTAQAHETREMKVLYRIRSGFESFANEKEQAQSIGLGLDGDLRMKLLPRLTLQARAGANLASGYAQSRFGDQAPASGLTLREAALRARLFGAGTNQFMISAGALDQGDLEADLLLAPHAFPGVREVIRLGSREISLRLWAQQLIPTSRTLSTRALDSEVTPSFMTETAEVSIAVNELLTARVFATHFVFNNLPSSVAVESVAFGNTTDETGPLTSQFRYRFEGFVAGGSAETELSHRVKLGARGYALQNAAAPEGYRNAQKVEAFLRLGLPGEVDVTPSAGMFFAESDAAPAFYNSTELGHNNRQGWLASVETIFRKERFKIRAEFIDADLINPSREQSRQQYLRIGLETLYGLF